MIETRNDRQDKQGTSEQECREKLLDQLAETLARVAEDQAEISDLQSCLERFDKEDLIEVDAEQALARFREKHHVLMLEEKGISMPACRHPTRKYFRRFAAVVAAAVFFSTMYIAGASDEGITKMIGRWTDETFHFGGVGRESISEEVLADVKSGIEGNYDSIEAALSACEITQAVFPKWIPDRFHLEEIYVRQGGSRFCAVSADYSCAGSDRIFYIDIIRYYDIANASSRIFEKDDSSPIEYESNGIIHYLIKNPAGDSAVWNNGNLICSITGDLSESEFQKVIDSIYKE